MLLLLKQYLLGAYRLSAERVRQFQPSVTDSRKCVPPCAGCNASQGQGAMQALYCARI